MLTTLSPRSRNVFAVAALTFPPRVRRGRFFFGAPVAPGYAFRVTRFPVSANHLALLLAVAAGALGAACAVSDGPVKSADATNGASSGQAAPAPSPEASSSGAAPVRTECEVFLDVVGRTTSLRASIHQETPTAAKADGWASESERIATDATALPLTDPDLLIENAKLTTRLGELTRDLRALAAAERGSDPLKKAASRKRVLNTSEQVEVLTREPAARCGGDPKKLIATSGHLPAEAVQRALRERLATTKKCYEEGLKRDPKLEGRVLVRLVIGLEGKVTEASPATADAAKTADVLTPGDAPVPAMPDAKVTACVVEVLRQATFPKPDGGPVTVVYPVTFSSR